MKRIDIPGQDGLANVLTRLADEKKLPHAMLIHGREGGLALPIALFLSRYILCDKPTGGDACGTCPSCVKMDSFTHPDVHFAFPVNRNKTLKTSEKPYTDHFISELRAALSENPFMTANQWYTRIEIENKQGFIGDEEAFHFRKKMSMRPYEGKHNIFIIWHADLMNEEFGNKILKSLEEPNKQNLIILTSEHPSRLLQTITSRVQRFVEEPLTTAELAEFLTRTFHVDSARAQRIAARSEGNILDAIRDLSEENDPWLIELRAWMRSAYKADTIELHTWGEKMASTSRENQKLFIINALKILDKCYRIGWLNLQYHSENEEADFYKKFSPFVNASNIEGFMKLLEEALLHVERNVNEKIIWFDTGIKVTRLIHAGKKTAALSSSNSK